MPKNDQLIAELDTIIDGLAKIPKTKNYWLIRTQGGQYYDSFRDNHFVAIEHEKISLHDVMGLHKTASRKTAIKQLTEIAAKKYPDEKRPGFIANQVYKFAIDLKKGDLIIIPSANSDVVSIGEVIDSIIPELSSDDIRKSGCPYKKRKRVKWIKHIRREDLDIYIYKVLQAHQAINNITNYGDIIERTINNFYINDRDANLILQVDQSKDINAKRLFALGLDILTYSQDFFNSLGIELSTDEIEVKINLNSKGKIQLKAKDSRTLWLAALLIIGINGGGLKIHVGGFKLDLTTDGAIQKVIDYQNNQHDRDKVDSIMKNMDSLKVKSPEDALKLYKQFSTNKDSSK